MQEVLNAICKTLKLNTSACHLETALCGDINRCYYLQTPDNNYFLKTNEAEHYHMFSAEFDALEEIRKQQCIRAPKPLLHAKTTHFSYLLLEHITLENTVDFRKFGFQLASMHKIRKDYFGWHQDNSIGTTLQRNTREDDWPVFWRKYRLEAQIELAIKDNRDSQLIDQLYELASLCHAFFNNRVVEKSLLHGDLWSGNYSSDEYQAPVIYDPASYFCDHETDLAMLELFGQPAPEFYESYQDVFFIDPDFKTRKVLYNLYHLLNHLHLFGDQYLSVVNNMTAQLLAETR